MAWPARSPLTGAPGASCRPKGAGAGRGRLVGGSVEQVSPWPSLARRTDRVTAETATRAHAPRGSVLSPMCGFCACDRRTTSAVLSTRVPLMASKMSPGRKPTRPARLRACVTSTPSASGDRPKFRDYGRVYAHHLQPGKRGTPPSSGALSRGGVSGGAIRSTVTSRVCEPRRNSRTDCAPMPWADMRNIISGAEFTSPPSTDRITSPRCNPACAKGLSWGGGGGAGPE